MKKKDEWIKFKKYPHIGRPLERVKDYKWVKKYVSDPKKIESHKFVPLIHRTIHQRKFRPVDGAPKNPSGKRERTADKKERDIYFASHLDSIIFGYYNYLLTKAYEEFLMDKDFGKAAVAYRRIPIDVGSDHNKSNIEFAFEAFQFIEMNKHRKLSIIIADVTSFFDNLDHDLLRKQWARVLGVESLPKDHFAVYKNLIAKCYVNEYDLFKRFQDNLIVERFKPHDISRKVLKRKKVNNIRNLKYEKVVAFCDTNEFFKKGVDLIRVDKPKNRLIRDVKRKEPLKGIPQGTPISATLANVYMIDFDKKIYQETADPLKNAFYQRYSDDLIIVCNQADEEYFVKLVRGEIEDIANLEIQREKTHTYRYEQTDNHVFAGGIVKDGVVNPGKQLTYLGFVYDGTKVLTKSAGFSKFHRAMKRSFRRGAHFARQAHIPSDSLFETRLYKRFTHLGSKRRLRWLPDPTSKSGYYRSTQYDWGNFISYINKANRVMHPINNDDNIKRQNRRSWSKFQRLKKATYLSIKK